MPPLSSISGSVGPVIDLALIATLVVFTVAVLKPLIALWIKDSNQAYDSALQLLAVGSGAGYIYLALYAPSQFSVLASAVAVAAGAMGGFRVIKGSPTPALTPGQVVSLTPPVATPEPAPVAAPAPETPPAP